MSAVASGPSRCVPTERIIDDFEAHGVRFMTVACTCGLGVNAQPHLLAAAFRQHANARSGGAA